MSACATGCIVLVLVFFLCLLRNHESNEKNEFVLPCEEIRRHWHPYRQQSMEYLTLHTVALSAGLVFHWNRQPPTASPILPLRTDDTLKRRKQTKRRTVIVIQLPSV